MRRTPRSRACSGPSSARSAPTPCSKPGGPGRDALTALLPELGSPDRDTAGTGLNRLHETVAVVLETVSLTSPVVVVIEDLHWADDATLNLLRFLLRGLSRGRILVDPQLPHRRRPSRTSAARPDLRTGAVPQRRRIDVQRLTRAEVQRQVHEILGTLPDDDAFDSVFARSEGIPFFVEELVGFDETCEGDLPWTLRELLLARYERLSDDTQHFLRLLSAGGVRVDHDLLVQVYHGDADVLDRAAREAVFANILVADDRSYAFRHALVREAIHADLLPGERTRFHTRFAEALEAVADDRRVATEISYHWLAAHDVGQGVRGVASRP